MTGLWQLPHALTVGGKSLAIDPDFRTVLAIFRHFQNEELPEFLRWELALALFYKDPVDMALRREAMEALADFVTCGQPAKPGRRLLDWDHDALAIVADVNKVAGTEVRAMEFVHWWTFLGWFHAIGEGQLSALVDLRRKLASGKKLEPEERRFYLEHRQQVDLPHYEPESVRLEKQRLNALLEHRQ